MGIHEDIKALLERNGAMGVNQLQKELGIPLSTLQKYLDKQQTYFKKNESRKWELPEISANRDQNVISENLTNIVDSQISSIETLIETLTAQLRSTLTLMTANNRKLAPVADESTLRIVNHPMVRDVLAKVQELPFIIKRRKSEIPEEYRDLLSNVDWITLFVERGSIYFRDVLSPAVVDLILQKETELDDELLRVLEEYV